MRFYVISHIYVFNLYSFCACRYTLYAKQCLLKEECHRCTGGRDKPNRLVVLCDILNGSKCRFDI